MTDQNTALVARDEPRGLVMAMSANEARQRMLELKAFVQSVMVAEVDYGIIPGTGSKPTLYQPGAQKLAELYELSIDFETPTAVEDWDHSFFHYRKRCILRRRGTDDLISVGEGSANSREDAFAYRWVGDRNLPPEYLTDDAAVAKLKTRRRRGNYGEYTVYRLPTENVCTLVNTIEKRACKRALVAAVLSATRSSGLFGQDMEDIPEGAFGDPIDVKSEPIVEEPKTPPADGPPPDDTPPPEADPYFTNPTPKPPPTGPVISEKQGKRLWAIAFGRGKALGLDNDAVDAMVHDIIGGAGIDHVNDIPRPLYDGIIQSIESYQPGEEK